LRISVLPAVVLFLSILIFAQTPDKPAAPPAASLVDGTAKNVVHIMGLDGVTRNAKGELSIRAGVVEFSGHGTHGKGQFNISSIQDVFTGEDSKQVGGTALNVVKMAAPFGSGRALSLFAHQKVDNLTIEYRDANNGFHGVIFVLPRGAAALVKNELIAQGAHSSVPALLPREPAPADTPKEKP
jgi:hypothetical protein